MSAQRLDASFDTSAPLQLVRAAATLRWKRPDLTVTLAELALDAADDAATWVTAAGWLLHGRTLLGDGRQMACDLLDGLGRWGDVGAELMIGPQGRRLRIELAAPARRTGEPVIARSLLAADPGVDVLDAELRADVLTELARCAADEAPDTADAALDAAEQAWSAAGCEPGVASVLLVRAARDRRAGRVDAAVDAAVAGLARVNASGRRAGGTDCDHLAAALTAEWIAALVDAGRLEEARADAVPAADRLLGTTRPSRQLAALRLAIARVAAVHEGADAVLAVLEPAAQDAADGDVPELESACRSMLGELHEAAGRLDAALGAVRAAMAAERCDHDRGARLRTRLAAATATWAGRPSGRGEARYPALSSLADSALDRSGADTGWTERLTASEILESGTVADEPGPVDRPVDPAGDTAGDASSTPPGRSARPRTRAGNWSGATGPGRRARRLAAEAAGHGWSDAPLPELGSPATERSHAGPDPASGTAGQDNWFDDDDAALRAAGVDRPAGRRGTGGAPHEAAATAGPATPSRTTDTGRAVAIGSGSLIGDALQRELIDDAGPGLPRRASAGGARPPAAGYDSGSRTVDSRTDRWDGGHGGAGYANGSSTNGVSGSDRRPAHLSGSATGRAGSDVADTVVFELDPHHDSTVAVPPVRPTRDPDGRDPADGDAAQRSVTRDNSPDVPADPAPTARPGPRRASGTDPESPVTDGRAPVEPDDHSGVVGADTVRVASRPESERTGNGRRPRPQGRRDPSEPAPDGRGDGRRAAGGPETAAPDRSRPRPTDTDGLGIGDLLAGALAAYRGI
jgi:hypothetical protein